MRKFTCIILTLCMFAGIFASGEAFAVERNLARDEDVVVTASGASLDRDPVNVVNGILDNAYRWAVAASSENHWIQIRLAGVYAINRIVIYEAVNNLDSRYSDIKYSINGSDWYPVSYTHEKENYPLPNIGSSGSRKRTYTIALPVAAQYIRLTDDRAATYGLCEFEIYGISIDEADEIAFPPTDAGKIQLDKMLLVVPHEAESDIALSSTGIAGSAITWESSAPEIISETGIFNKPERSTIVTLTATIKIEALEDTKVFEIMVKGYVDFIILEGINGTIFKGGPFYPYKAVDFKDLFEVDGSNGTNGTVPFTDGGLIALKEADGIRLTAKATQTAGPARNSIIFNKTYNIPEITDLGYQYYIELLVNDNALGAVTYDFGKNGDAGAIQIRRKDNYTGADGVVPSEGPATYVFLRNGEPVQNASFTAGIDTKIGFLIIPPTNKMILYKDGVRLSELLFDFTNEKSAFETLTIKMYHSISTSALTTANHNFTFKSIDVYQGDFILPQEMLDADIADFKFNYLTNERQDYIKSNLALPDKGKFGSDIIWTSSDETVVNPVTGVVTRGIVDKTITLTATFKGIDMHEETMEFEIVVKRKLTDGNVAADAHVSMDVYSIEPLANLVDEDLDTFIETLLPEQKPKITVRLEEKQGISGIKLYEGLIDGQYSIKTGLLEVSDDGKNWTVVANVNGIGEEKTFSFEPVIKQYIRFTVTDKKEDKGIKLYEMEAFLNATPLQLANVDANNLKAFNHYIVTESAVLPTSGIFGSNVSWTSSNTSVISNTGVVSRPENDTTVTLTATVTNNGMSATISFNYLVTGTKEKQGVQLPAGGGSRGSVAGTGMLATIVIDTSDEQDASPSEEGGTRKNFEDVSKDHWAFEYINSLYEKGVVLGDGSGNFYPQNEITREEFLKMLMLILDIQVTDYSYHIFDDVKPDEWYSGYVYTAYNLNICKGLSDEKFGVGDKISRQDMAVMTVQALKYIGIELPNEEGHYVNDLDMVSDYAKDDVSYLVNAGIITGDLSSNFNPFNKVLREQASKILSMVYDFREF